VKHSTQNRKEQHVRSYWRSSYRPSSSRHSGVGLVQDHIRKVYEARGFDGLWAWAKDGKGKRERYRRFRALQRWAQGNRDGASGEEREKWNNRRKAYRDQKLKILARINDTPDLGTGAWGGSESIIDATVLQAFIAHGIPVTSTKRSWGPGSDHWTGSLTSYAADGGIANAQWLHGEIAVRFNRLGIPLDATPVDYVHRFCTASGNQFRYQGIAATHGTGPHYHGGVRRV
jgi:hypothetical protein